MPQKYGSHAKEALGNLSVRPSENRLQYEVSQKINSYHILWMPLAKQKIKIT